MTSYKHHWTAALDEVFQQFYKYLFVNFFLFSLNDNFTHFMYLECGLAQDC